MSSSRGETFVCIIVTLFSYLQTIYAARTFICLRNAILGIYLR
jgi:hypothetical protein